MHHTDGLLDLATDPPLNPYELCYFGDSDELLLRFAEYSGCKKDQYLNKPTKYHHRNFFIINLGIPMCEK